MATFKPRKEEEAEEAKQRKTHELEADANCWCLLAPPIILTATKMSAAENKNNKLKGEGGRGERGVNKAHCSAVRATATLTMALTVIETKND